MTWQAKGAGGGGGWSSGMGGGFGGQLTPFGRNVCIVLGVCFAAELFARYWLGADGIIQQLVLWPVTSSEFRPWQVLTYPFVGHRDPLGFLLTLLVFYFFAGPLERYLGTGRFYTFLIAQTLVSGVAGAALAGFVSPQPLPYGGVQATVIALVVAFGWLNRSATILLFFVLPVRAIYITYVTIFFEVAGLLSRAPWSLQHLAAIGLTYAVVERGVRLPDVKRQWLLLKQKRVQKKLGKFQVIDGGKRGRKDGSNGDPRKPVLH